MNNPMKIDTLIKVKRTLSEAAQRATMQSQVQQHQQVPPLPTTSPVVPTSTVLPQTTNAKSVHTSMDSRADSSSASLSTSSAITSSTKRLPSPVRNTPRFATAQELGLSVAPTTSSLDVQGYPHPQPLHQPVTVRTYIFVE